MIEDVLCVLRGFRFSLNDEKALQVEMDEQLLAAGLPAEREVRLGPKDVIDFVVRDIGVEVKIKGARRAIYLQVERYAQHERLKTLVLATNVSMGFPSEINGKPVHLVNLGRAWL